MRAVRRLLLFLLVRNRSLTVLLVLFAVSLTGAFADGFWLLARLANVILLVLPVAFVWSWLNVRGLDVGVERASDRLQVGGTFQERLHVRNRSWLGKLWLEVHDLTDMPGTPARRVVSLGPRAERTWRAVWECTRRGLYSVGPAEIASSDLFGLFRRTRTVGAPQQVLVYPRVIDLRRLAVPPAQLPGEGRRRRPTHQVTPNASGVREYQPGDSLNRFHWRSTARTGRLMVKLFDLDPASDIWVVLDLHGDVQAGAGDDGTEEHGITIAASLARHFLLANRSVGLLAYGRRFHLEEPERGLGQYTRILEALAVARATGDVPVGQLLTHEARRFGRHTTVIVVTPSTDESWVESLQLLAGDGAKLAVVLLEPRAFGGQHDSLLVFGALAAAGVVTYHVKRADDLATGNGSLSEPEAAGARA